MKKLTIDKARQLIKDYKGVQGADMFITDLLEILVFDTQSISAVKDLIDYYTLVRDELRKIQIWEEVLDMEEDSLGQEPIEYTEEQIKILEYYYDEQRRQSDQLQIFNFQNYITMEQKLNLEKDQHLMSIRKNGECLGHIEIEDGKIVTSGVIGINTYDNFVELIKGLQGFGIAIDNFYY
jgi:type I site-specific restriction endonuclease